MGVPDLATLRKLRTIYAVAALDNLELMPIFERIDGDCSEAEILAAGDPVAKARLCAAQERAKADRAAEAFEAA